MFTKYTTEDDALMISVGIRIRVLRQKKELTQSQLGIDADIPTNQVGRIERAEINTSLVTLGRIAKALEVKLSELFTDYDELN